MTHEPITKDHILTLASSPAVDPALVRYDESGELEVRSTVPGGGPTFEIIVSRDGMYDIDDEWDGQEMSEAAAADVADHINQLSREQ